MNAPDSEEFGIYVHWPYCAAICPYCDFNVYRARGADNAPLLRAILSDMDAHAARFGKRRAVSLFLGGGTPSLLSGAEVEMLIAGAQRAFDLPNDAEITIEANPENADLFAEQAAAGVNRFSIGAQAFDDVALKALGRFHDSAANYAAIEAAARTGQRVSLDLIYAREGQSVAEWAAELDEALSLPVEHVSLYQLTIEAETAFAKRVERGTLIVPDTDLAADLYEATQTICEAAGFDGYEISNHARGAAARARHNLVYWRGGDWVGVGPGAHGRMTQDGVRLATEAARRPADYLEAVHARGLGWSSEQALTRDEQADEFLIMGLRVEEGVDVARLEALRGAPVKAEARAFLVEQGLLYDDAQRLRLTRRGRLLANQVAAELAV